MKNGLIIFHLLISQCKTICAKIQCQCQIIHALIAHENFFKLSASVMKNWIDFNELLQQLIYIYISSIHSMHENCII